MSSIANFDTKCNLKSVEDFGRQPQVWFYHQQDGSSSKSRFNKFLLSKAYSSDVSDLQTGKDLF